MNTSTIDLAETVDAIRELISAECPNIARECVEGTAGAGRYWRTAVRYVQTHFPQAELAFTYGSTARGNPSAFSDIDLYILNDGEPGLHVLEVFDELPIEARVMSRAVAEKLLSVPVSINARAAYLANALESGKRVWGSDDVFTSLQEIATHWFSACPRALSLELINQHRVRITGRVLDLASVHLCSYRRAKAVFEIADSIRILSIAEKDIFQGKNLLEHLSPHWPERAFALAQAIDAVFEQRDALPLVKLAIEALEPYGGLLVDRFRRKESIGA